jgi:hypothetical protein
VGNADRNDAGIVSAYRRGCLLLMAGLVIVLFVACAVLSLGVSTQMISLPPVLLRNNVLWIGDSCRAYLNTPEQYSRQCRAEYTVDLFLYGRQTRRYILFRIPDMR